MSAYRPSKDLRRSTGRPYRYTRTGTPEPVLRGKTSGPHQVQDEAVAQLEPEVEAWLRRRGRVGEGAVAPFSRVDSRRSERHAALGHGAKLGPWAASACIELEEGAPVTLREGEAPGVRVGAADLRVVRVPENVALHTAAALPVAASTAALSWPLPPSIIMSCGRPCFSSSKRR